MLRRTIAALSLLTLCLGGGPALGIPTLQLYSPGATYDQATESWVTIANPFQLWVVGAPSPNATTVVTDVTLFIAAPQVDTSWDAAAQMLIVDEAAQVLPLTQELYGSPEDFGYYAGSNYPPHDVFPTRFWPLDLPNLEVGTAGEPIWDFISTYDYLNPGPPQGYGDIQYYDITFASYPEGDETYFDVIGLTGESQTKFRFAPFSHNTTATFPEPATIALLATGMAGLALLRTQRRRRGRGA